MKTLYEVEVQAADVQKRLDIVFDQILTSREDPEKVAELAETLVHLLQDAKVLATSLAYFRELSTQLVNEPCSGPH